MHQGNLRETNRRLVLCFLFAIAPLCVFTLSWWSVCVEVENESQKAFVDELNVYETCDSEISCASCVKLISFRDLIQASGSNSSGPLREGHEAAVWPNELHDEHRPASRDVNGSESRPPSE